MTIRSAGSVLPARQVRSASAARLSNSCAAGAVLRNDRQNSRSTQDKNDRGRRHRGGGAKRYPALAAGAAKRVVDPSRRAASSQTGGTRRSRRLEVNGKIDPRTVGKVDLSVKESSGVSSIWISAAPSPKTEGASRDRSAIRTPLRSIRFGSKSAKEENHKSGQPQFPRGSCVPKRPRRKSALCQKYARLAPEKFCKIRTFYQPFDKRVDKTAVVVSAA